MRFAFIMDPLERVAPAVDTSQALIEAALARGHECLHALVSELSLEAERVAARLRPLRLEHDGRLGFSGPAAWVDLSSVDATLVRKDPPFDDAYYFATLLLERLRGRSLVVNDPRGLREANEKLYALRFPRWTPQTMVTADRAAIRGFVSALGGRAVIKPLDGHGGFGVLALDLEDCNMAGIIDLHTREGTRLALVQEFLPEVALGDKRILLLDGEPLGAILRVPAAGELRANLHVGGEARPTELTEAERALVAELAPELRADGLYFVGLDVIGGRLTEVNVTSPTGIRQLDAFTDGHAADRVVAWLEQRARR
jgi:glutathione synthase